ncbi:MAG: hypothetical protein QXP45_00770 [Thermoproteota archaeon]
MKRIMPLVTVLAVTILVISCAKKVPGNVSEEEVIIKLIETASTKEDHMKIADYYEKQAEVMEEMSRSHASKALTYQGRGGPFRGPARHCSSLSRKFTKAAEEYKAMAMEHENIAKEILN